MSDSHRVDRRLFVHGAHRTVGVPSAALDVWDVRPPASQEAATSPLEVVLLAGQLDSATAALVGALRQPLAEKLGARVTVAAENATQPPGEQPTLGDSAVVVLLGDTAAIDAETLEAVARRTRAGGGLVSLATVPDRRQVGRRFQWSVLGAQIVGSANSQTADVEIESGARLHPAGRGLDAPGWTTQLAAAVLPLSADAMVLLSVRAGEDRKPVAWARQHGQGRVFGTLLGGQGDCAQPGFVQLAASAVSWAGRK